MDSNVYETNDNIGKNSFSVGNDDDTYFSLNNMQTQIITEETQRLQPPKNYKNISFNPVTASYMQKEEDQLIKENSGVTKLSDLRNNDKREGAKTRINADGETMNETGNKWKTIKTINEERKPILYSMCPICTSPVKSMCSCEKQDSICGKGHQWHNINGVVKFGSSHHNHSMEGEHGGSCVVM